MCYVLFRCFVVLFGGISGTYGAARTYRDAEFWDPVDLLDSIDGHIGILLVKLDKDYPQEGWYSY